GCLSGELYECADVLHIGNKGGVVGLKADAFPNNSVNGLLERWLKGGFFRFLHIAGNERRYIKIPHPFEGTLLAPASETNITIQWPRTADAPSPVSPEMESASEPTTSPPEGKIPVRIMWGAPFD